MPIASGGGGGGGTTVVTQRKTTTKTVSNTVTETDLLNGEFSVAAGKLGTTGHLFLSAWGTALNNSGATQNAAELKLKLGATTLFDTGNAVANGWAANASAFDWFVFAEIMNTATNAQVANFKAKVDPLTNASIAPGFATGTGIMESAGASHGLFANGIGSSAVDTTSSQTLQLTVILPTNLVTVTYALTGAFYYIL